MEGKMHVEVYLTLVEILLLLVNITLEVGRRIGKSK
jgi:hypothetical protein